MRLVDEIIKRCRRYTHPGVINTTALLAQEIIDLCESAKATGASTDATERDADSGTGEPSQENDSRRVLFR